jgi:PAS domain S-box-containing protein
MNDRAAIKGMRSKLPGGLLSIALLVLLLLLAYQLLLSYRDKVRTAELSTRNYAAIFEARLDATLRRTDADLKALASEIPVAALNQSAVPRFAQDLNANLDSRLFNVEEMTGYRVHDANGDTLYSSSRAQVPNVNIADRAYFKQLRDGPGSGLLFSDVLIGRSTNRQVMVIARALRDDHGRFMGIVHGMLDLEYYTRQFSSLDLGTQGIVALHRSDNHTQVVRWPDSPDKANKPLAADHPLVQRMTAGEHDFSLHYSIRAEGVPRILSVTTMQHYPFYFAVGIGRHDVLAGWYSQVMVVAVSTLLLFGLVSALLFRLGRMREREAGILTNLAQSESQFSELAQMVPVGICHFDADGVYTYVNDRHMALTGRSRSELLGCKWSLFVHPDDRNRVMEAWVAGGKTARAFVCEYRLVRPDGQASHVLAEVQTEFDLDGKVLGYIVAQTDISLRKQAEAELLVAKRQAETANLAKTRFLAAASHDLRQPIQAINLFQEALSRTGLSEEQQTISRFLDMSVRSLGELLYSLLDISKLDAGLVRPLLENVSVEVLFKAVDSEFSPLARQRNLRFKLFYPFKSLVLLTDSGLLLSVLRNLIDNAFKYTEQGGVLVGVRKRDGYGVIQVWDTGIGIDPQYGERVFDECFQVGNPLRDRAKGLGIGLSIARRTARLLGGDVTFSSRPGWGTVFEIVLPLAEHIDECVDTDSKTTVSDSTSGDDEAISRLRGWRVVVIEDDPVVAKSIELLLQSLDINVQVFQSAELALGSKEIATADFYISDFSLPGMNGLQLLDTLQQRSTTPINAVLLTGETSPQRIELATSSNWRVLFKPAELSRLVAVMSAEPNPTSGK